MTKSVDKAAAELETEIIEFANAAVRMSAAFLRWIIAKRGRQVKIS